MMHDEDEWSANKPILRGGQGRTSQSLRDDAVGAVLTGAVLLLLLILAVLS